MTLVALGILAIVGGSAAPPPAASTILPAHTLQTVGHGEVRAKPDTFRISFFIETRARTSDEVGRLNSAANQKLLAAVKARFAASAQIEVHGYSVMSENPDSVPRVPQFSDYESSSAIAVETPRADRIPILMHAAIDAGANPTYVREAVSEDKAPGTQRIDISLMAVGATPEESVSRKNKLVQAVTAALKRQLASDESITETENYIQPKPATTYRGFNDVVIELARPEDSRNLIDLALHSGATSVMSATFTLHNDQKAKNDAIALASADAQSKAQALAKSMGVKIDGIRNISTSAQIQSSNISGVAALAVDAQTAKEHPASIEPPDVTVPADVTVIYDIKP